MPEILLGSEIFTDWTRESEYKFRGAKLERGVITFSPKRIQFWTLDGV